MNETATRILPCPSYDMEAVESWLTDQAKQGWYLERQGDYFGRFHFRKDVPRALPYRLVSSLESTTVLQQTRIHGSPPPQEVLDLAAYSGWEYVALIEGFYVIEAPQSTPGRWKPTLCFNLHPFERSWDTRCSLSWWPFPSSSSVFSCFRPPLFAYPPSFGPPSPPL